MIRIALLLLFNAPGRYATLIASLAFVVVLTTMQTAVFFGVLERGTGVMQNVHSADLWVVSPETRQVLTSRGIAEEGLYDIRRTPGVAWAEPLLAVPGVVVEASDGTFFHANLIGIDRRSMISAPEIIECGDINDLRLQDTVLFEATGNALLQVEVGDTLRLNDHRARVVGICRARGTMISMLTLYANYETALNYTPVGRQPVTCVLVKVKRGADPKQVAEAISARGQFLALTTAEFRARSQRFMVQSTALGINFLVMVGLAVLFGIGVTIAAFHQFTTANLAHFALMKSMGARTPVLTRVLLTQIMVTGLVGYGIGVGLSGLFVLVGTNVSTELAISVGWELLTGGIFPVLICLTIAGWLAFRRLMRVDPEVLFR